MPRSPISQKQRAANRANAAKSTGPRAQNRNFALGEGFHRMARQSNTWSLFLRYQAQAERHYRRAVEEFERLRALRTRLPNEPVEAVQLEENKTADAPPNEPISPPK